MCAFDVTHPDVLTPENKLDDVIYSHSHNVEGQADLNQLPQSVQDLINSLGNKKLLGYELVEEKNLLPGTTACTFNDLDGDLDKEYLLELNIDATLYSDFSYVYLLPNNNGDNLVSEIARWYISGGDIAQFNNVIRLAYHGLNGNVLRLKNTINIFCETGKNTIFNGTIVSVLDGAGIIRNNVFGQWKNNSKLITLDVKTSNCTIQGNLKLWKRIPLE